MTLSNTPSPAITARQCDKMIEALTDAAKQGKRKAGVTTLTLTDGTICLINVLLGQYAASLRETTPIKVKPETAYILADHYGVPVEEVQDFITSHNAKAADLVTAYDMALAAEVAAVNFESRMAAGQHELNELLRGQATLKLIRDENDNYGAVPWCNYCQCYHYSTANHIHLEYPFVVVKE